MTNRLPLCFCLPFITAIMSADLLDNPVLYEQLNDLEDDFEEVELELGKSEQLPLLSSSVLRSHQVAPWKGG